MNAMEIEQFPVPPDVIRAASRNSDLIPNEFDQHGLALAGSLRDFFTRDSRFNALTPEQRRRTLYEFFSELAMHYRGVPATVELNRPELNPPPLEIPNRDLTEVQVLDNTAGRYHTLTMGFSRKIIFGYAVLLTEAKMNRFLTPWLTRKEISFYSEGTLSPNQLSEPLNGMVDVSLLEVNRRFGYRLRVPPSEARSVFSSDGLIRLIATGFEFYSGRIAVPPYKEKLVMALAEQLDAPENSLIDFSHLREATGLSQNTLYDSLKELENAGVITRDGARYLVGDINASFIREFAERLRIPIVLSVINGRKSQVLGERSAPLDISDQENTHFPAKCWDEHNFDTSIVRLDYSGLKQIELVLTEELGRPQTVVNRYGHPSFTGRLPFESRIRRDIVLGVLDFLGLGPDELAMIDDQKAPSVAALITRLEDGVRKGNGDRWLLEHIKNKMVQILFKQLEPVGETKNLSFKEIMALLLELNGSA